MNRQRMEARLLLVASAWFVGWLGWHLVQWANRAGLGQWLALLD